jgi:2-desacetyl-2-hydroxyethyl bacteriochlorophyllide A dehydrogenase
MEALAIVFRKPNKPVLESVELPEPQADELVVATAFSGVSIGTERSIFTGERTHNGTFPLVGGYMASGTVEWVGEAVSGFVRGDRVVCTGARLLEALNSVWGGHSSRQIVRAGSAMKIPESCSLTEAAMFVLPGVGLNAVNMADITMDDTVLIQGQGLIGQFCGQWCRNRGARVITLEPDPSRRALSHRYVTQYALDPGIGNVDQMVEQITEGRGPSVVVEATGAKWLVDSASRFLRRGGKMVFLSWYPDEVSLDFRAFHDNQATAYFPTGFGGMVATRAVLGALASGAIVLGDNLTHVCPYHNAPDGYRRIIEGDGSVLGMVIDWQGN